MADFSSNIPQLSTSQFNKEKTANGIFDAASVGTYFGRDYSNSSALTWAYLGAVVLVDGTPTRIANGTLTLANNTTNYIEATRAGVVSSNTSGFTAGRIPLYQVTTVSSAVTNWLDVRYWATPTGRLSKSVAGNTDVTLTAIEARNDILEFTGALTGNINVIVPAATKEFIVFNNTSGAFSLTVKTAAGSGVTVVQGKRDFVYADGTNVVDVLSGTPGGAAASIGKGSSTNNKSKNNTGTPNTKFDLIADQVVLADASNNITVRNAPGTITCDVAVAGPTANGRDQAGAFSASSWVYFYWIGNGATTASVASPNGPATGPVLPPGYTTWEYCAAVYFDGSSHLMPVHVADKWVFYDARQVVLGTGTATTETAVSTATLVPPSAMEAQFEVQPDDISDGSGNLNVGHLFRVASGSNFYSAAVQYTGLGLSQSTLVPPAVIRAPNIGQNFYYLVSSTSGTARLSVLCHGYSVSN